MSIIRKKTDHRYYMMVDNKKIYLEETTAKKDIGVVFDPNQNFRPHMGEICKKANRIMVVIRRTYSYLTKKKSFAFYTKLWLDHTWKVIMLYGHQDTKRMSTY